MPHIDRASPSHISLCLSAIATHTFSPTALGRLQTQRVPDHTGTTLHSSRKVPSITTRAPSLRWVSFERITSTAPRGSSPFPEVPCVFIFNPQLYLRNWHYSHLIISTPVEPFFIMAPPRQRSSHITSHSIVFPCPTVILTPSDSGNGTPCKTVRIQLDSGTGGIAEPPALGVGVHTVGNRCTNGIICSWCLPLLGLCVGILWGPFGPILQGHVLLRNVDYRFSGDHSSAKWLPKFPLPLNIF